MNIPVPRASLFVSVTCFFLLTSAPLCFAFEVPPGYIPSEKPMGTLMNLDLSQLIIEVSGWPPDPPGPGESPVTLITNFAHKLEARAVKRLTDSGLYKPAERLLESSGGSGLRLSFRPMPLSDCPGKVLYEATIELLEEITIKRDPDRFVRTRTWHTDRTGVMDKTAVMAAVESDLDSFIDEFIFLYKRSNPAKKKP